MTPSYQLCLVMLLLLLLRLQLASLPLGAALETLTATGGDTRVLAAVVLTLRGAAAAAAPTELAAAAKALAAAGVDDPKAFRKPLHPKSPKGCWGREGVIASIGSQQQDIYYFYTYIYLYMLLLLLLLPLLQMQWTDAARNVSACGLLGILRPSLLLLRI